MNRLVIIGNGFDLAHGLPTSYKDFIDDYWVDVLRNFNIYYNKSIFEDEYVKVDYQFDSKISVFYDIVPEAREIKSFNDFKNFIKKYSAENDQDYFNNYCHIHFKNNFFKNICDIHLIKNWVDIENEYYRLLKEIAKLPSTEKVYKNQQVIKLNTEFEEVKSLLEKYLKENVVEKYNFKNINSDFHNIFYPDILDDLKIDSWKEDFSKEDKDYINELIIQKKQDQVKLRFLNFNYTPTLSIYFHMNRSIYSDSEFFIHGKLKDSNNKINFGFGDEMDEDYKLIENIDDNEYLKNFKSFQYLQNDTYKKLMDFVDSEKFEVFIMGSSCGLSDRTLLNTIFEHENCRLIKVFYYQWEENGEKKDNFTELTQNISRHFNDKKLMRSKIVHKKPEHLMPKIPLSKI